jgi:hypothetical protein
MRAEERGSALQLSVLWQIEHADEGHRMPRAAHTVAVVVLPDDDTTYARPALRDKRIRDETRQIDLYIWINRYEGRVPHRIDGLPLEPHAEPNRPFFVFVSDAGYHLARSRFGVLEAPKPDVDPDATVPTLRELLLRR